MSCVTFHAPDEQAEVGGSERVRVESACVDLVTSVMEIHDVGPVNGTMLHRVLQLLPVDAYALALNTMLVAGCDELRLAARIFGICEVHGWIDGGNRAWASDLIQRGVRRGVLRDRRDEERGWRAVSKMLRRSSGEPVVISHSGGDAFPNFGDVVAAGMAKIAGETHLDQETLRQAREKFLTLSRRGQWALAFEALRAQEGLEIRPDSWSHVRADDWSDFRFGHRLSAFDLVADDWRARLDHAFPEQTNEAPAKGADEPVAPSTARREPPESI